MSRSEVVALVAPILGFLAVCCSSDGGGTATTAGGGGEDAGQGASGTSPAGASGSAGTSAAGAGPRDAGTMGGQDAGSGGSATFADGGTASGGGGAAGSLGLPDPTEDGLAVYTVECAGESQVCGYPDAHCLGIYLDDGGVGFACSNLCESVEDCSDAPSGAEAEVGCIQFSAASRCVLVCRSGDIERQCPTGMGCYSYPNSGVGYCLYL